MIIRTVIVLLALVLSGCSFVGDMQEMSAQQSQLQEKIKEQHGWDVQVGWNIHNGVLTNVTVMVETQTVAGLQVSEVEAALKTAVSESFEEEPKALVIQIISTYPIADQN